MRSGNRTIDCTEATYNLTQRKLYFVKCTQYQYLFLETRRTSYPIGAKNTSRGLVQFVRVFLQSILLKKQKRKKRKSFFR